MIFISKDARALLEAWRNCGTYLGYSVPEWHLLFTFERLTMKFDPRATMALLHPALDNAEELLLRPATRIDAIDIDLRPYEDTYRYVCTEYVVHDYNRIDALKLAAITRDYPCEVVKRVGDRCRYTENFTIPYLAAALENEGAKEIDKMRRENRVNELIAGTHSALLPTQRFPGKFSAALENARTQDEIKKIARGDR